MSHPLFSVHGVEIEYAITHLKMGRPQPRVPELLSALGGSPDAHPSFGLVELDNELAAHVVEIKARMPSPTLLPLLKDFQSAIKAVNTELAQWDCALLPGGMHPLMDPTLDTKLWDHEDNSIYSAFDRVFDCRGHGWFNIQSVHLNLPFSSDAEFSQLHNAISLILPLLPALSSASPIWDGKPGPWLDGRLYHYSQNQKKLPEISGPLVPEPIHSEAEYREKILQPMFLAIAPFDPEGVLQDEWLNSRAAIARFDRNAIEIRCMDTQANPLTDLALCHFATCLLKYLIAVNSNLFVEHAKIPAGVLRTLFLETARLGRDAILPSEFPTYLFLPDFKTGTVGSFLSKLLPAVYAHSDSEEEIVFRPEIEGILSTGTFAEHILKQWERSSDPLVLCQWMAGQLQS